MRPARLLGLAAWALLVLALASFAASSGVFVRDIGSGRSLSVSGPLDPHEAQEVLFNAFELTYDLAIFSTVRVRAVVEAAFGDWRLAFESNGSFVTAFRPELPGVHRLLITNLEDRPGQLGWSLLQAPDTPPELETSLLTPLLNAAGGLLLAAAAAFVLGRRPRREGGG